MQEQYEKEQEIDEKKKRMAVALTVAGTLLFLFLLAVLIVQFVKIGVGNARLKELNEKQESLEQMNSEMEKDLEYYLTEQGLYLLAREQGWGYNN